MQTYCIAFDRAACLVLRHVSNQGTLPPTARCSHATVHSDNQGIFCRAARLGSLLQGNRSPALSHPQRLRAQLWLLLKTQPWGPPDADCDQCHYCEGDSVSCGACLARAWDSGTDASGLPGSPLCSKTLCYAKVRRRRRRSRVSQASASQRV